MATESKHLCSVPRWWVLALFPMLLVSLLLNLIVAIGNWNLYARVERLEASHEQQATPQSPQKSSQGIQQ